jgi:hypothetical protein
VLPLSPRREYKKCALTISKDDNNQNGKGTTEMNLTGTKARKLSNKRAKFENLQKVPEGTSQKENLQNGSFTGISEQQHMALHHGDAISLLGPIYPFDCHSEWVRKNLYLDTTPLGCAITD